MPREILQPTGVTDPRPRYSQISRFGNKVFIAGQLARDSKGTLVGKGDVAAQTRQIFENLKVCLEEVGASLDNVAMLNVYLTDIGRDLMDIAKVRQEYFSEPVPSTTVGVAALADPDALVEIEADVVLE